MAEPTPPAQSGTSPVPGSTPAPATATPAAKPRNPVFRMMGLPALPKKLPSRKWMIFWAVTGSLTAAIVYDKREKKRAIAKWRAAVAPLAKEPISNPNQLARKLTIYIEAPPGDGLRVAQDHFIEYVKPVLAASGLDWEFVQGREQGDVRAAVAEKIRRSRREVERPNEEVVSTDDTLLEDLRKQKGLPEYEGIKGDLIMGRHTWKEYIRGLHEGWLGPLDAPQLPDPETKPVVEAAEDGKEEKPEEEKKEEKKPDRPPQPPPYNSPEDYSSAVVPAQTPSEFYPSGAIPFPHRLGFTHTFVRLNWYLNRRKLADSIGREVAAVCFATCRDWQNDENGDLEQGAVLAHEEADWPRSTWKKAEEAETPTDEASATNEPAQPVKEQIWTSPMVTDPRIVSRMRRFEANEEVERRAAAIVVPEEEIEGFIKGSLRSLWRWGAASMENKPKGPNVGNLDDD